MPKFPITRSNEPGIAPRTVVTEASAKQKTLELESPEPGGVLRELALARWQGLPPALPTLRYR